MSAASSPAFVQIGFLWGWRAVEGTAAREGEARG
jgi:hypothetical protein